MSFKIAIDGPSGAGKTTLAKLVAKELGFTYIDTGAMYRTVGLYMVNNNVDLSDEKEVVKSLNKIKIELIYEDGIQHVYLNKKDVSDLIRTPEITRASSIVSAYKKVRERLVVIQRELASSNDVIMDGRDIGTNVLKDADIKIFLTANVKVRALRRTEEFNEKGIVKSKDEVEQDLRERDDRDINRKNNPLKQADDAILVDTTNMTIEEEVKFLIDLVKRKRNDNNA